MVVENKVKYLGVWFTPRGIWTTHVDAMLGQARKALFMLRKVVFRVPNLPLKLLWHFFDTLISPVVVLYGSEIWGPTRVSPDVDRIEARYGKAILRIPNSTSSAGAMIEHDRALTIWWKAKLRAVSYWIKIINMPETRYVKAAYRRQRELARSGMSCWASGVEGFLSNMGYRDVWETEMPDMYRDFIADLRTRTDAQAYAELLAEVQDKPSLEYHREYKRNRGSDPKLLNMPGEARRAILLGRLKCYTFTVFSYKEGARIRICSLCKAEIDHEWNHILKECPIVAQERLQIGDLDDPAKALFSPNKYELVAKFIIHCIKKRSTMPEVL